MNKFSLYILLILVFLGLSKSFSLSEKGTQFIKNEFMYTSKFDGSPLSLILIDAFETGFLIKSYFHKYKLVYGFRPSEIVTYRVPKAYYNKTFKFLGLSLFRREEIEGISYTLPMPAGALYIGDRSYGEWILSNSGQLYWKFYRAYRDFPSLFIWGNWRPTKSFYKQMIIHQDNNTPYFGDENQFGRDGSVVIKNYKWAIHEQVLAVDYLKHVEHLFSIPRK